MFRTLFIFILLISLPLISVAQERITDEEEAREVFSELDTRRSSIDSEMSLLNMEIINSSGRSRSRTMQSWTRNEEDGSDNLIVFTDPGNVRGTGFLSVSEGDNEIQRLYLPSLGRIQTIGAAEKDDQFMGSDFTYEDLGDQDPDDYEFEWLEIGDTLYTVRASKPESEQYSFVEFDIEKERYALREVRYFNQEGELIKRLVAEDFEQVTDSLWSPRKMTMYDLRDDRRTVLTWQEREVNADIPEWRFTERGLRRGV